MALILVSFRRRLNFITPFYHVLIISAPILFPGQNFSEPIEIMLFFNSVEFCSPALPSYLPFSEKLDFNLTPR